MMRVTLRPHGTAKSFKKAIISSSGFHRRNDSRRIRRPLSVERSAQKMKFRFVAALAAVIMLSAIPVHAQDQFGITPPTGWVQTDSPAGVLGLWVTPASNGFRQNLNLVSEPYSGSLANYVAANRDALSNQEKDLKFGPE